ncbi:MAG: xanthine dehydrogenase family protein molybdopterin-binding subunit [Okeania sp. SIO3B5]|uniref:xanthine dehydrogenase family protein molybdopterin-binding subunit n=1 Tax=Okeania sp. SIO3B5 TaxID=2607811 RepID=UPI0014014760|nr:xanthine dehydrogenase family protein molybdopterin-binding subunit [Okeania sp. SIO3B5]NEO58223.1 xanthine dehydrogenase family protein molybdopterin-binding subunit [Okeania sp. SIO3B5]
MNKVIGKPINRVDGKLKVTGGAHYTADMPVENLTYGVLIESTIAKGKITKLETTAAETAPGVLAVITYRNVPKFNQITFFPGGQSLPILQDENIYYQGQHIGIVVAKTLEQAQYAATLVKVEYQTEQPTIDIDEALQQGYYPEKIFGGMLPAHIFRGDITSGHSQAEVLVEQTYSTPMENHNPIEPSATLAVWEDDYLTLYETTQGVCSAQGAMAKVFDIPPENIRVISEFLGGGFGCKAFVWPHAILATLAARYVKHPVKLVLTRAQMYTSVGYRAPTKQHLTLGATKDGKLTLIKHIGETITSPFDEFTEPVTKATKMMYSCPNVDTKYRLGRINASTPTFMRAPGEAPGMFALESAMDELSYALELDPIELRIRNHADVEPATGHPWSSKSLKECYHRGAEIFGWKHRNPKPRSMSDGESLIGWGMASATFPAGSFPATAKVTIYNSGEILVESATHDLGTGTYTVMTQVAAEVLGVSLEKVEFKLGDTKLPKAPVTGNSTTASSVGTAVQAAATKVRSKVVEMAISDSDSPLYQAKPEEVIFESGKLLLKNNPAVGESYQEVLTRHGLENIEAVGDNASKQQQQEYAKHSFGGIFVEVRIERLLGEVRVTRCVGVYGAGRILNAKTARSQMIGGITWGIGMALMEHTVMSPHYGRILNHNLSDYLIPVQLDVPDIQVQFVEEEDPYVNALGTKGIGELSIVGVAGAIANAVYHATGKRIRDLPITPDKLG